MGEILMKKKTERKMWGQMNILIVYCHPSTDSFTYRVKEAFIKGIREAGHSYEVSDLYQMGFQPLHVRHEGRIGIRLPLLPILIFFIKGSPREIPPSMDGELRFGREPERLRDDVVFRPLLGQR